jgi:hypothetical protein
MKHIKTFESFLNEAHLPFDIEKKLRLNGVSFELDEDWTEEGDDRFEYVEVYTGDDRSSGTNWMIKVGETAKGYMLEIAENEKIVFTQEYLKSQKAYFEQDCMNSIGFLPID